MQSREWLHRLLIPCKASQLLPCDEDGEGTAFFILWLDSIGEKAFSFLRGSRGGNRLVHEEALLTPLIKEHDPCQHHAAQQICSQYVTGPVLTQINSRYPNE